MSDGDDTGGKPTVTFAPGNRTRVIARYEYLNDERVADRGVTSFKGRSSDPPGCRAAHMSPAGAHRIAALLASEFTDQVAAVRP